MNCPWLPVTVFVSFAACGVGTFEFKSTDGGIGPDGSSQRMTVFRPTIHEDIKAAGCLSESCHGGGPIPMQLIRFPSSEVDWQTNYEQVNARTSILVEKSKGSAGHLSSLVEGGPTLVRWREWIDSGAPFGESEAMPDAGTLADAGPQFDATPGAVSWSSTIREVLVDDGCTSCHGLQGAYSLESYSAALGFGTDQSIPNVIPGDSASLLVTYYDNLHHTTSTANAELIRRWIVQYDARE
ncbi:MAG: hypothetical protein JKY56_12300 [Kofleriaceae bacterium]|nr:hypothetical protein [Kofleriaceae bacterium]